MLTSYYLFDYSTNGTHWLPIFSWRQSMYWLSLCKTVFVVLLSQQYFSAGFWHLPGRREGVINTLRPRQDGRHFADDTFKHFFLNENVGIFIKLSLKFVPKGPINNIPALAQIMAWRRPSDKPLSEAMLVSLLTHICVTRPQWVKLVTIVFRSIRNQI